MEHFIFLLIEYQSYINWIWPYFWKGHQQYCSIIQPFGRKTGEHIQS